MVQPRLPVSTVQFIDTYCQLYQSLFSEVRSFEHFKYLHVGLLSNLKRKTLPEIAKIVGLENGQSLHHFLSISPWEVQGLRRRRLDIILKNLDGRPITLIIDDTGDAKKGKKTDYVKRQYIGNLGKVENGIVAVTAYGYIQGVTFPLMFKVYKPKERLKETDHYYTKPELAAQIIRELQEIGFTIELVLADSLYGEAGITFESVLSELKLNYILAIRSNHGVWLPEGQTVRANQWRQFNREFTDGKTEVRYIREIIFGKRQNIQFWEITTDYNTLPEVSTWYVKTKVPHIKYSEVGNFYGIRTWVEYGLKQSKNELGWADFRLTHYPHIEKWWEIVMSAYLLVSLHCDDFNESVTPVSDTLQKQKYWNSNKGWKAWLNNLRLILQPFLCFHILQPWLKVFSLKSFLLGFLKLIDWMNWFDRFKFLPYLVNDFFCPSP